MLIKTGDLYILTPFFNRVAQCKLTVTQCVKNSTVINRFNEAMKIVEAVRIKIATDNCKKDDKGETQYQDEAKTMILLTDEGVKALNELMDIEQEVNLPGPQYSVEELEKMGVTMDASEYEALKRSLLKPV